MERDAFQSASGLRPMSAFVVVGAVIAGVAVWLVAVSEGRDAEQPDRVVLEEGISPAYSIVDAQGRTLASFVPRFDLEMSPRAMWQAHTPDHMAAALASALAGSTSGAGTPSATELLDAMLPDAEHGTITSELALTPQQAWRVSEWIESGAGTQGGVLRGIWLEELPTLSGELPRWSLRWQPEVLLASAERVRRGYSSAWRWGRAITAGLDACLSLPLERGELRAPQSDERRAELWRALIPRGWCRPVRGLSSAQATAVRACLAREGVSSWQMRLCFERDRAYPCGPHELLGDWGFVGDATQPAPREGLERLCDTLLASDALPELDHRPSAYAWLRDRSIRGERSDGFLSYAPPSAVPRMHTTIELPVAAVMHAQLEQAMREHEPALAMAIAVDVESGDVLAVDSIEKHPVSAFAPIWYTYTPGSTFKVLTAAVALEEGAVTPETEFSVEDPGYVVPSPRGGRGRRIREAEHPKWGRHPVTALFGYSLNGGLAQIGLCVRDAAFRGHLVDLGYGRAGVTGLGAERPGTLAPLPWSFQYTHASISFGHEISVTLWQHTTGVASVLRDGRFKPLRLVRGVEQDERLHALPTGAGSRVLSSRTSQQVRDLMSWGAQHGTGKVIWRDDLIMGTKTGTAQKVAGEACVHVEMEERASCERAGEPFTNERWQAVRAEGKNHARDCYTSSIFVWGRRPEGGREVLVYVVVEEPTGTEKYGAPVSGQAAAAILAEALGLTRNGVPCEPPSIASFVGSASALRAASEEPWRAASR
jgi:cell division protein FtsI/penicillin-binding protein 2